MKVNEPWMWRDRLRDFWHGAGPRSGSFRASLVLLAMLRVTLAAHAAPPPDRTAILRRGVNLTGWFLHPGSGDPAALRAWLSDAAMEDLRRAGFTFVRLAVDPAVAGDRRVLRDQISRLQSHGLAVVVSAHPGEGWNPETGPEAGDRLVAFWRGLARDLRTLPPNLTFPEGLNEPVFHDQPAHWWAFQERLRAEIRAALPDVTIVLTGQDWGSIGGLLTLPAAPDGNVVYSFHYYDPAELTSLAAYRPGLDRGGLAALPFPVTSQPACDSQAALVRDGATRDLMMFYCATGWDATRVRTRLEQAAAWARDRQVAVFAGEFGASQALNPTARLAWLRLVRETLEAQDIGWALWGYDDSMGLAVPRPPPWRPVLDRTVLLALGLKVF